MRYLLRKRFCGIFEFCGAEIIFLQNDLKIRAFCGTIQYGSIFRLRIKYVIHTECLPYRLGAAGEKGNGCESRTIPVAVCVLPVFVGENRSLGN